MEGQVGLGCPRGSFPAGCREDNFVAISKLHEGGAHHVDDSLPGRLIHALGDGIADGAHQRDIKVHGREGKAAFHVQFLTHHVLPSGLGQDMLHARGISEAKLATGIRLPLGQTGQQPSCPGHPPGHAS